MAKHRKQDRGGVSSWYVCPRLRRSSELIDSQATRRLLSGEQTVASAVPEKMRTNGDQLRKLDMLATERLLAAGGAGLDIRRKLLAGPASVSIR
jgi:hypothetical protein